MLALVVVREELGGLIDSTCLWAGSWPSIAGWERKGRGEVGVLGGLHGRALDDGALEGEMPSMSPKAERWLIHDAAGPRRGLA